jgi:8-oxo-dGTP pyrophosphatase MutT (NUDIX family)
VHIHGEAVDKELKMSNINWKDRCWVTNVYLVRADKKVLLNWNKNINTWMSIGGHIDIGENPEMAIMREVAEETGFEFEFFPKPDFINDGNVKIIKPYRVQIEKVPHHNEHINIIFFGKCTKWFDKKSTDEDEKLRWFSKEELIKEKDTFLESVWILAIKALEDYEG